MTIPDISEKTFANPLVSKICQKHNKLFSVLETFFRLAEIVFTRFMKKHEITSESLGTVHPSSGSPPRMEYTVPPFK